MSESLRALFADPKQAQQIYRTQLSKQRLFVPVSSPMKPGAVVSVTLEMTSPPNALELRAKVLRSIDAETARKHSLGERSGVVLTVPITDAIKGPLRAFLTGQVSKEEPSSGASGRRVPKLESDAITALREEVEAYLKRTEGKTFYEALEVPRRAKRKAIRKSYMRLMRRFHPDTYFRQVDAELLDQLEVAFQRVNAAFETLGRPRSRDRYDLELGDLSQFDPIKRKRLELLRYREANKDKIARARELWRAAEEDEAAGRLAEARNKLKLAKTFDPRNPLIDRKIRELDERS